MIACHIQGWDITYNPCHTGYWFVLVRWLDCLSLFYLTVFLLFRHSLNSYSFKCHERTYYEYIVPNSDLAMLRNGFIDITFSSLTSHKTHFSEQRTYRINTNSKHWRNTGKQLFCLINVRPWHQIGMPYNGLPSEKH